jgi:ATP-dependent helicase/DNAse subunit B
VDLSISETSPIVVAKGAKERAMLDRYLLDSEEYTLSPTALFRYVECPLKFYLNSIAHLRTSDEVSDTIDALTFGNILHETMQGLYTPLIGVKNPSADIAKLCKLSTIEATVDSKMGELMLGDTGATIKEFTGDMLLVRDIIVKYIMRGIMRYDIANTGYTIDGLEDEVKCRYAISKGRNVNLSGRADRLDRLPNGTMQIIDYKSGNTPHLEFNGMNSLFTGEAKERISNIFQTLLYSMMLNKRHGCDAKPTLYYASKMLNKEYSPEIVNTQTGEVIERYSTHAEEFEETLSKVLEELFDYDTPFTQVENEDMCKYCDYKRICRR